MRRDLLIHPGEILREEFMAPHNLSANRLATALGVPANRITSIANGERGISGETAMLLSHAFGTSAEFWLNLQATYDLDVAKLEVAEERLRGADALARELCIA